MIKIEQMSAERAPSWSPADRSFTVHREARLCWEDGRLALDAVEVPPYLKTYDDADIPSHAESFVAFLDGQPAGEARHAPHWNGYLCLHDLVVGQAFRRRGVGQALARHAIRRAGELQLSGVVLETQNINWAACRLYERCGFQLGGFDRFLYKAVQPGSAEIALFWYWVGGQGT